MQGSEPTLRRVLLSAAAALVVVLGALTLVVGFSDSFPLRLLQGLAVFCRRRRVIIGGAVVLTMLHFAGWHEPESEEEFELIVQRAERLAAAGAWGESDDELDPAHSPYDEDEYALSSDEDFRALVRSAIDDLPLEFHRALEHVAVVVTDGGREARGVRALRGRHDRA